MRIALLDVMADFCCFLLNVLCRKFLLENECVEVLKRPRQSLELALDMSDVITTPINKGADFVGLASPIGLE